MLITSHSCVTLCADAPRAPQFDRYVSRMDSMTRHDIEPDTDLTADQLHLIGQLSDADVQAIDNALLSKTSDK